MNANLVRYQLNPQPVLKPGESIDNWTTAQYKKWVGDEAVKLDMRLPSFEDAGISVILQRSPETAYYGKLSVVRVLHERRQQRRSSVDGHTLCGNSPRMAPFRTVAHCGSADPSSSVGVVSSSCPGGKCGTRRASSLPRPGVTKRGYASTQPPSRSLM